MHNTHWSKEDIAFLYQHMNHMSTAKIAEHLKRTENAILQKIKKLGMRKNEENEQALAFHCSCQNVLDETKHEDLISIEDVQRYNLMVIKQQSFRRREKGEKRYIKETIKY